MLREYQEEIQKLKSMLEGKDGDIAGRKMLGKYLARNEYELVRGCGNVAGKLRREW